MTMAIILITYGSKLIHIDKSTATLQNMLNKLQESYHSDVIVAKLLILTVYDSDKIMLSSYYSLIALQIIGPR